MPAHKKHTANFRAEIIRAVQENGTVSQICRDYKISRKTYYKWVKIQEKEQTLHSRKQGRKSTIDQKIENLLLELIKLNPNWSVDKLYTYLKESNNNIQLVSRHWVQYVLEKRKLSTKSNRLIYSYQHLPQLPKAIQQIPIQTELPVQDKQIILHAGNSSPPKFQFDNRLSQLLTPTAKFVTPYLQKLHQSVNSRLNQKYQFYLESVLQKITTSPLYTFLTVVSAGFNGYLASRIVQAIIDTDGVFQKFGVALSAIALFCGTFFFIYSIKYYFTIVMIILKSRSTKSNSQLQELDTTSQSLPRQIFSKALNSLKIGINDLGQENNPVNLHNQVINHTLEQYPFFSIQIPLYNEKRVADRVVSAAVRMDYPNFEIIVCDDSTDETTQILREKWGNHPKVKILHRDNRAGYKGAALANALNYMDKRTDYVVIFDADFVPYPDTLNLFAKYFAVIGKKEFGNSVIDVNTIVNDIAKPYQNTSSYAPQSYKGQTVAVQGYQWHVLNKSENWITRAIRSEFAGSYIVERSGTQLFSLLKQIAGSVYAINASVLKEVGWGSSITEDFQLTLNLYEKGYKVAYTPYIQAPSECVSTLKRLIRQRQRWAEGHSFNIKKHLHSLLTSDTMTRKEKWETVYLTPYYLQALIFIVGTTCWIIAETILKVRLPFWTSALGWSLVLTNLFSLPLMNTIGLFLEEGEERDYLGIFSFVILCYLLAPFIGWAALKGFVEQKEGPWFRTPKSGRITDKVQRGAEKKRERLANLIPWLRPAIGILNKVSSPKLENNLSPYLAYATASNSFSNFTIVNRSRGFKKRLTNLSIILLLGLTTLANVVQTTVPQAFANPDTYYFRATQDSLAADNLTSTTTNPRVQGSNTIGANTQTQTMSATNPTLYMLTDNLNKVWTNDTKINDSNTVGDRRNVAIATHTDGSSVAVWEDSRNSDTTQNSFAASTGGLVIARNNPTVTPLLDGRVLIASGSNGGTNAVSTAEVYDPVTQTSTQVATNLTVNRNTGPTATLLNDGRVLFAGGGSTGTSTTDIFDPNATSIAAGTTGMNSTRQNHVAVKLLNGKVLVAGGQNSGGATVSSAELYDPQTGTWTLTGTMSSARFSFSGVVLSDGQVLVAGSNTGIVSTSTAEIYNPVSGTWSKTANMPVGKQFTALNLLSNGKVLSTTVTSYTGSDIFDPVSQTWSSYASHPSSVGAPNGQDGVLQLPNGKLFYSSNNSGSSAFLYDPMVNTWTSTDSGTVNASRTSFTPALLSSGKVLLSGGIITGTATTTVELYSPVTYDIYAQKYDSTGAKQWSSGTDIRVNTDDGNRVSSTGPPNYNHLNPSMSLDSSGNAIVAWEEQRNGPFKSSVWSQNLQGSDGTKLWPKGSQNAFAIAPGTVANKRGGSAGKGSTVNALVNGKALIVGTEFANIGNSTPELYDPVAQTFTITPVTKQIREGTPAVAPLLGGQLLITGGSTTAVATSTAETYNPVTNALTAVTAKMVRPRNRHTATTLKNGKVLIVGTSIADTGQSQAELYDPTTATFSTIAAVTNYTRQDHDVAVLPNGKALIVGGSTGSALTAAELFDPVAASFTKVPGSHAQRQFNSLILLNNGNVLSVGTPDATTSAAELYNPVTQTWVTGGAMLVSRKEPYVALLPNGKVLVSGGLDNNTATALLSSELYDPSTNTWTAGPNMTLQRDFASGTYLPVKNKILVAKGANTAANSTAELYTPVSDMPVSSYDYKQNEIFARTSLGSIEGLVYKKPKVAIDSNGDTVIVWQDDKNIHSDFQFKSYGFVNTAYNMFAKSPSANSQCTNGNSCGAQRDISSQPIQISAQKICSQAACGNAGTTSGERQWGNDQNLYNKNNPDDKYVGSINNSQNVNVVNDGTNVVLAYDSDSGSIDQVSKTKKIYSQKLDTSGNTQWSNNWTGSTGKMINARYQNTATLLNNGRVLLTGGQDSAGVSYSSAELYNSLTQTSAATTGNMTVQRTGHSATLLDNGKVLVAGGGQSSAMGSSSANLYEPSTNTFLATTGNMIVNRTSHTATLLRNGKVLLAGGLNGTVTTYLSSAELFTPSTGTFTAISGNINTAKANASATLMADGRVLIAGGSTNNTTPAVVTASAYDPVANTSASVTSMATARTGFTLTLLNTGKILAVGGYNNTSVRLSSAELYDPLSNAWTTINSLTTGIRSDHAATIMPNGKVLITGGNDGTNTLSTSELYDPVSGTFTTAGPMNGARSYHTTVTLPNGQIGVFGGSNAIDTVTTTSAVVPATNNGATNWTTPGNAAASDNAYAIFNNTARNVLVLSNFGFSVPANGNITGVKASVEGNGTSATTAQRQFEISLTKDASTLAGTARTAQQFTTTDSTLTIPSTGNTLDIWGNQNISPTEANSANFGVRIRDNDATAAALNFDLVQLQLTYTTNDGILSTAELYSLDQKVSVNDNTSSQNPDLVKDSAGNFQVVWQAWRSEGLTKGGSGGSWKIAGQKLNNPASASVTSQWPTGTPNTISSAAPLIDGARTSSGTAILPNGKFLIAGGSNGSSYSTAIIYDPVANTWTATGSLNTPRESAVMMTLSNGKVLIVGGNNGSTYLSTAELYDPATGTWTYTTNNLINGVRTTPAIAQLKNGKVLIAGGNTNASLVAISTSELYDPATGTWANTTGNLRLGLRAVPSYSTLANGDVLIFSGYNAGTLTTSEIFNATTGTWTASGNLINGGRLVTNTFTLNSGKVLSAGGTADLTNGTSIAELFDPSAGTWTNTGFMSTLRVSSGAVMLGNGKVIVAGGGTGVGYLSTSEIFNPVTGTWTAGPFLPAISGAITHGALLKDGRAFFPGGQNNSTTASAITTAVLYNPEISEKLISSNDSNLAGNNTNPKIASDSASGISYVAWSDDRLTSPSDTVVDQNIYLQKVDTNGSPVWPNGLNSNGTYNVRDIRVDTTRGTLNTSAQVMPSISKRIYNSSGSYPLQIAWNDTRDVAPIMSIYAQAYDTLNRTMTSTSWTAYFTINNNNAGDTLNVLVGATEADGETIAFKSTTGSFDGGVDGTQGEKSIVFTNLPPSGETSLTHKRLYMQLVRTGGTFDIRYNGPNAAGASDADTRLDVGIVVPERSAILALIIPVIPMLALQYRKKIYYKNRNKNERGKK